MSKLIGYVLTVYNQLIERLLAMVAVIKSLNPAYKQPGDGSNGTCDCIGLIIGAMSRMGIKWPGIHGSNYAARYQTVDLAKIQGAGSLELGDMVFKACEKGTKKWKLPDRYLSISAHISAKVFLFIEIFTNGELNLSPRALDISPPQQFTAMMEASRISSPSRRALASECILFLYALQ